MLPRPLNKRIIYQAILTAFALVLFSMPGYSQSDYNQSQSFTNYLASGANNNEKSGTFYVESGPDTTKSQNPTVALFKSLLVPGLGQIGNKKYIKAVLVIGLESTLIGTVAHYADKTSAAKRAFDNNTDPVLEPALFKAFDDAKDRRNYFSWLLGTLIFISMFDAYVDAHLANFPKYENEISLDVRPTKDNELLAVVTWRF